MFLRSTKSPKVPRKKSGGYGYRESRLYSRARVDPSPNYRSKGVRAVLCQEVNTRRSVLIKWGSGEEGSMEHQDTETIEEEPETGLI